MEEPTRGLERTGVALFRLATLALPGWLRDRAAGEMEEVFLARHRRAEGLTAVVAAWSTEIAGALWTGLRARFDRRSRLEPHPSPTSTDQRMDNVKKDVRYALRTLVRRPTTTIVAVATLGLGIAASTAMFSVVNAVLLTQLPFPEADRIVRFYPTNPSLQGHPTIGDAAERGSFSPPEYTAVRELSEGIFEASAMVAGWSRPLVSDAEGPNERLAVGMTTHGFLSRVLAIAPLLGRYPGPEDQAAGRRVLVLTEGFWERRYGRDPTAVGRSLFVNGNPHEIVGIAPAAAQVPGSDFDVELWRLIDPDPDALGNHSWYGFARLSPGVTPEQAATELTRRFGEGLGAEHDHGVSVFAEQEEQVRGVEGPLLLLTSAALLLLLVAVGNVAVLLVGVALDRKRELAVRGALGAPRSRLFQQLLTEAVVLSGAGAAVGVALAATLTRALVFLAPEGIPRIETAGVDLRVLAFAAVAAVVCGVLAGILPSLSFSSSDFRTATASSRGTTDRRARIQGTVVVAEIALATVLLTGGALLVRTVLALQAVDPGFDIERTVSVGFTLPSNELLEGVEGDSARYVTLEGIKARIADEITALPGVTATAYTSVLPLGPGRGNNQIRPDGADGDEIIIAERRFVTPGYLEVMGIELLEGRVFEPADDRRGGPGVMIISESTAQRAWPGESALGRRMDYWGRATEVIGVVRDVNDEDIRFGTDLAYYVPAHQAEQYTGSLVARVDGEPDAVLPAIRDRVLSVSPTAAVHDLRPMRSWAESQMAAEQYRARLAAVFAGLAVFFSLIGVYAVTSRTVVARTREIGVRMALGAERQEILARVLGRAGRLALAGAALGLVLSLGLNRFVQGLLFGVDAADPLTLGSAAAMLALAAVAAAWLPGRRATQVDPVTALRSD